MTPTDPGQMQSSLDAADQQFEAEPLSSASTPCGGGPVAEEEPEEDEEKTWIEIQLVDEADEPVPGQAWKITHPDGTTAARGRTNSEGVGRVSGIENPGNCEITFTELDEEAWEFIETVDPST
jgi:hypothetical protein